MTKYTQGKYKPLNPKKYRGDPTNIVYRSSWERKLMFWLDTTTHVLEWCSEETIIPYKSPIDGRYHRYFVDFNVKIRDAKGTVNRYLVEVKPHAQTLPPKKPEKVTKSYVNAVTTYGVNKAKWEAAENWCQKNNSKFMVLTEKELFGK